MAITSNGGSVKIIWPLNAGAASFLPITPSVLTTSAFDLSGVDVAGKFDTPNNKTANYYRQSSKPTPIYSSQPKTDPVKTLGVIGRNESGLGFKGQIIFAKHFDLKIPHNFGLRKV
jgi:hypothetical protein